MPNHTFSREKNRELSTFEVRVGSIRRRLSNPLGRKKQVARAFPLLQKPPEEMGGKKNRRRQASADWYASGTDESNTNAAGNHKISYLSPTEEIGERADGNSNGNRNGNGPIDTRKGPRRSCDGKKNSLLGLKHESTLGQ